MSPSAERKRAGFVIAERLWVGMYGETFKAAGAGRRDLHALIVDARISREPGIASTLLDETVPALRPVHHRAIVGTVAAVRDAGDLVVITEEVPDSITLHEMLAGCRARGIKVTQEIAAAVGRAIVDAAATAHAAGVIHGAIHPRSVLIDGEGNVRLADLAIGRAVVVACGISASPDLLRGHAGYMAPELIAGGEPGPAFDVYAIGALLYMMLSGELPPGSLNTSPAMERLIQRALDADLARRFQSAIEMQENLAEALEDDRWYAASNAEMARFVARARTQGDDALDAQTEDLLASLGSGSADAPTRDSIDIATLEEPRPVSNASGSLDSLIADLEEGDEPMTEVDGPRGALRDQPERDPISEMLAIERARTGAPVVDAPEPSKRKSGERARRLGEKPGSRTGDERAMNAALESLDDESGSATPVKKKPRTATPFEPHFDDAPVPSLGSTKKIGNLVWLVVLLAAGAALVWVIMDLREKGRQQAKADAEKIEEKEKMEARLEAELADPGAIRVSSEPGEAAVWLSLGRTPMDSFALPTGQMHELRLELDGHQPLDLAVTAKDWKGDGENKRAELTAKLEPGTPARPPPPMPEWAPAVLADMQRGLSQGRGVIHVETTPAGAAVWLLVGKSGSMKLEGIESGRDYELKVVKPGYTPGYVHIKAEEWRNGGDERLPLSSAPKHALLERTVTLVELPR